MRCKACDAILATEEMVVREETGEFDDLCTVCRKASVDWTEVEVEFGLIKRQYTLEGDEWDD